MEAETDTETVKRAVEEVVTEGDTKVEVYQDAEYPEEYDEYCPGLAGSYPEDEAEYYQREYTYKAERRASAQADSNKSKPMPKQNSLFIFSHTNRYCAVSTNTNNIIDDGAMTGAF